jgi:pimeloyl-ACP methyl ester carboxylesterase
MATSATPTTNRIHVNRTDHVIPSEPDVSIFVREVTSGMSTGVPVLLVHGGGPGGLASFDLPVPGYSVAEDLASAGHAAFVMDVRGWGGSTRPAALDQPVDANPPAVRSNEAVTDIAAVVDWIRQRGNGQRPALLGWASGGRWCGMVAANHPHAISHLVMLNSLYAVDAPWGLRSAFEHPDRPGEFDASAGAYRVLTAGRLIGSWDAAIPGDDPSAWRDPEVTDAFRREALASDPASQTREPPAMRAPAGFQHDSYLMARGTKLWDAADLTVPVLAIRGDRDHWSRPEDVAALRREAVNAPEVSTVTIPGGTHYLFLDRPERGHARFLREVTTFLTSPS